MSVNASIVASDRTDRIKLSRNYWTFFAATGVSSLGDGLVTVALSLLAASITRDPLALAGMVAALRLPWLFCALPLGAIADRVDTRRMAATVEAIRALLLVLLSILIPAGAVHLTALYGAAFVMGVLEAAFVAATSSAVPNIVPAHALARANGRLFGVNLAADDFVGVGLGGALFTAAAALPFLLDGASFAASALLLWAALPRAGRPTRGPVSATGATDRTRLRTDIAVGLRHLVRGPAMRVLLVANTSLALIQAMVVGILVAFALGPLHLSRSGYGLFLAFTAAGAVVGGAIAGPIIDRLGGPRVIVVGAGVNGAGYIALSCCPSVVSASAVWLLTGVAVIITRTAIMALRQACVPAELQARTGTAFRAVVYGAVPLGALLGGALADATSLRAAIACAGIVQVALVVAGRRSLLSGMSQARRVAA